MSESLLRLPEVRRRTGKSKSAIYAGMMAGSFPRARKDGRASGWLESEIDAYLRNLPEMGQSMGLREPQKKKPLESAA